jgi:Carboxypeptidase regulatory-like domain
MLRDPFPAYVARKSIHVRSHIKEVMTSSRIVLFTLLLCSMSRIGTAQVFGTVRVTVHDPQNLPVSNADVTIKAMGSAYSQMAKSNAQGDALFVAVPFGQYLVSVTAGGFDAFTRAVNVISNAQTPIDARLSIAGLAESVGVEAEVQTVNPESSSTETLTHREDILLQPSADRTGSLAMITNNVPGTFVMHDHLHSRGGHGVTWEIDGVPVPNSNLASSGAQFDPKDVSALETERGGLSANYGDRSYGVFNVVPRSGFEAHKFGEAQASYGSFHRGDGYFSFGDHTSNDRFAYFASVNGSRTDLGLERVDIPILHDEGKTG